MPIPASNDETLDPVCKLPQEVGPCRAGFRRWTYDLSKGQCVQFTYGGCRGNANNFETKEACEAKCGGVRKAKATTNCVLTATHFEQSLRFTKYMVRSVANCEFSIHEHGTPKQSFDE
ncbi:unnamed protein product [Mesocestoides corti]|uniref:BPTI/Kunitz inhibitor domain-containing protein n=1 Tax=Mesocestoides corti TaxID=53468 RepID=A0A0R3URM9_MESCO|nr:unnamed protein product [Mesocestoides corti]